MNIKIDKELDLDQILSSNGYSTSQVKGNLKQEIHNLFKTENSRKLKSIVYIFKANKSISRLRGTNSILYIGKSINTLYQRYNLKQELNEYGERYEYVLKKYDGFTISIFQTDSPDYLESLLLWRYRKKHLEFPPLNLNTYNSSHIENFLSLSPKHIKLPDDLHDFIIKD